MPSHRFIYQKGSHLLSVAHNNGKKNLYFLSIRIALNVALPIIKWALV